MLVEMTGIKKSFQLDHSGMINVLNGIDLFIERGEMIAIKGASGAGKSTLLHILGCLDRPSEGKYLFDGINILSTSSAELSMIRNKKIGFIMQHFALIEEDTVLENVGIPLMFGTTPLSQIDQLAQNKLIELGVGHLSKKTVSKLSGGEKQRVAIARALVNDPEMILADEPTGSLDRKNAAMIMNIFKELNNQGKTIIIVTHDETVATDCARTVVISDGILL